MINLEKNLQTLYGCAISKGSVESFYGKRKRYKKLEKRNKKLQIENYPLENKLFLNFDADIVATKDQQSYWKDFLNKYIND